MPRSVNRLESRAELTLTPPQMGRVEVSISVSGDQTSAAFVSASPAAREALEQALPRLREILAEAGITLGQASVNAESPRQDRDGAPAGQRGGNRNMESAGAAAPAQWLRRSEGLIDTFA
jgi:flagellar hook-length control protein FliK